jgi:hypothetical protein
VSSEGRGHDVLFLSFVVFSFFVFRLSFFLVVVCRMLSSRGGRSEGALRRRGVGEAATRALPFALAHRTRDEISIAFARMFFPIRNQERVISWGPPLPLPSAGNDLDFVIFVRLRTLSPRNENNEMTCFLIHALSPPYSPRPPNPTQPNPTQLNPTQPNPTQPVHG